MSPHPAVPPVGAKYLDLIRAFPLRPIRTDEENEGALQVIASLAARGLDPEERDYLDVLVGLVEKFEAERYPMPPVSGPAMVRHLIESKGVTQAVVADATGIAESALSEILAGKRGLSTKHVKVLARYFGVRADLIVGD
jgi:HTH-type transcriptional regulator/antitoxin HigA